MHRAHLPHDADPTRAPGLRRRRVSGERVVIAGGSGFLGRHLARGFREEGREVLTIGREHGDALWHDSDSVLAAVDGAAMLINLAGRSVDCRHTIRHKKQILGSRVFTTDTLGQAVERAVEPPPVWFNASTTSYYPESSARALTEEDRTTGVGFTSNVAVAWERELAAKERPGVRQVALRLGTVLGPDGGALPPLLRLARLGLGGPHAGGAQWVSWVHVDEVHRIIRFIADHDEIEGPVNVTAPDAVTDRDLMAAIRRAAHVRFGLPSARWMVELGAWALRTEPELVLRSSRVAPARLLEHGYTFEHGDLDDVLRGLVAVSPAGRGTIA